MLNRYFSDDHDEVMGFKKEGFLRTDKSPCLHRFHVVRARALRDSASVGHGLAGGSGYPHRSALLRVAGPLGGGAVGHGAAGGGGLRLPPVARVLRAVLQRLPPPPSPFSPFLGIAFTAGQLKFHMR